MALVIAGTVSAMADDYPYPYLTFETADGAKTSISSTELTITIQDGKLMVGSQEFTLTDLSKMYFSVSDETEDGIRTIDHSPLTIDHDIYDLQGREVSREQMKSGVYVMRTKEGTIKVVKK